MRGFAHHVEKKLIHDPKLGKLTTKPLDIRITYPVNGDQFIPENEVATLPIKLKARVSHSVPQLTWFVDGKEYETVGPPYESLWDLTRGFHEILIAGPNQTGDSVFIKVH